MAISPCLEPIKLEKLVACALESLGNYVPMPLLERQLRKLAQYTLIFLGIVPTAILVSCLLDDVQSNGCQSHSIYVDQIGKVLAVAMELLNRI